MSSIKTCPACNYTRQPTDDAVPEWECPKCQKAYNKIAQAEHPQVSVVMAQSSSDYIQVSISGENKLDSGSQIHFDGSQHVDPIAMETKWTPAVIDRTSTGTPELVEVSAGRIEFNRTKSSRALALAFIIGGIVFAISGIYSTTPISSVKGLLAMGICFLFIVFGCFIPFIFNKAVVFDKLRGYFWKGRKGQDEAPDMNSAQELDSLENIHALQLVYWQFVSNVGSAQSAATNLITIVELNLVLRNGRRVNVATYEPPAGIIRSFFNIEKKPREHAATLGRFLGKPVWDAIETTKSYWNLKR